MRVGSLFSGIGGFDIGLERAGMQIRWQVENNEYCRRILQKHWPGVPCFGDIKTIDWRTVEPVDLVCGGFPCQPFSVAGKQRGAADDRYLWPEVVRCLDALRPTWFLGENVPGIINLALDQVCTDLESLGYAVWPVCVPACAVDAPHIRQRLWIVAHARQHSSRSSETVDGPATQRSQGSVDHANGGPDVADSECNGWEGEWHRRSVKGSVGLCGGAGSDQDQELSVAHAEFQQWDGWSNWTGWWAREPQEAVRDARLRGRQAAWLSIPESELGRVAHGVSHRVDRLKGLGNAIVPQIAEILGQFILTAESIRLANEVFE